jgi:aconitate hydratase
VPADSFGAGGSLAVDGISYRIFRLGAIGGAGRLPFSLKVLLENRRTCCATRTAG